MIVAVGTNTMIFAGKRAFGCRKWFLMSLVYLRSKSFNFKGLGYIAQMG